MHCSLTSLVLATIAVGQATAASISHLHGSVHNHAQRHSEFKRSEELARRGLAFLNTTDVAKIAKMNFAGAGYNAYDKSEGQTVWIGSDGPYTNEFSNASPDSLILVVWGVAGSWIGAKKPLITVSLAPEQNTTLSFADGASGAWSAIYPETVMSEWGQLFETWGEFTFGEYGVVDVSREVNMNGRPMSIIGPTCTTDMDTCVFVCGSGETCEFGYKLHNCATGSQPGANFGSYGGADSGGCGGMGSSANLTTILGKPATSTS